MKKTIIFAFFVLALCGFAAAQTQRELLEKVKQIKPLADSGNDVRRILIDYESDEFDEESYFEYFFTDFAKIEVSYSNGKCAEDEDEDSEDDVAEIWNVAEWKTTKIIIDFNDPVKPEDIGYDLSKFKKEKRYPKRENSEEFIYNSKSTGVALIVDENEIERIIFYPAQSSYSMLCDNRPAKTFASGEGWFGNEDLKASFHTNLAANVTDLVLSATEITADCPGKTPNKTSAAKSKQISVKTTASDPENDVLTYNYTVSVGKIVGTGANVVWDLTGVEPGTYTITAGADDGCGICGETRTVRIIVKECVVDKKK